MGSISHPSPERLETILRRQDPPAWGAKYTPGMLASREEAPSTSRPSTLSSSALERKEYARSFPEHHSFDHLYSFESSEPCRAHHAMSSTERDLLIFALYHPSVFDVHEQAMLSCTPRQHPLQNHPEHGSKNWPSMRGTVQVAESLGFFEMHPTVLWRRPGDPTRTPIRVPFPYLGDLLIFFYGANGPAAVNWNVKGDRKDFERPAFGSRKHRSSLKAASEEKARHAIETTYYADARICTIQLTGHDWSENLKGNLRQLFLWHDRKHNVPERQRKEIVSHFQSCIGTSATPHELTMMIAAHTGLHNEDVKTVMYQAIWCRELRVDLFDAFSMDHPMLVETEDPTIKYSSWLREL